MPNDAPNGNDNLRQRVSALEQAQEQMDRLSLRMLTMLEQQQQYLATHNLRLEDHDKRMEEIERQAAADREKSRALDERIDKLVSAIGELIRQRGDPLS